MESSDKDAELRKILQEMRVPVDPQPRPTDEPPICTFCGAGRNNVKFMFSGKYEGTGAPVFICGDSIEAAQNQMSAS